MLEERVYKPAMREMPEEERPRERLLRLGAEALRDASFEEQVGGRLAEILDLMKELKDAAERVARLSESLEEFSATLRSSPSILLRGEPAEKRELPR